MTASPLGRYDRHDVASPRHQVTLLALPVRLLADSRDRHDSLMREFALLALSRDPQRPAPPRLLELTEVLGVQFGSARPRPDEAVDRALREGLATIDVTYEVDASVVAGSEELEVLMASADEFCRSEDLLTLPRSPLQVRFARWYLEEFRRQVAGEPPRAWDGPLDV